MKAACQFTHLVVYSATAVDQDLFLSLKPLLSHIYFKALPRMSFPVIFAGGLYKVPAGAFNKTQDLLCNKISI